MLNNKKDYFEILGIIGVIGSLIFVGMQLSLDRNIALAGQYQSRAELRIQVSLTQLESSEYLNTQAARWEGQRPNWWNSEVEEYFERSGEPMIAHVQDTITHNVFAISMDNDIYQYDQGLMSEENWISLRNVLKRSIQGDPLSKAFITSRNSMPHLTPVIDQLLHEIGEEL